MVGSKYKHDPGDFPRAKQLEITKMLLRIKDYDVLPESAQHFKYLIK